MKEISSVHCHKNDDLKETKKQIVKVLKDYTKVSDLEVITYVEYVKQIHEKDYKILSFIFPGTILATFIFLIGLFALISFYLFQKDKEIGLRRVFGASNLDIVFVVLNDFKWWLIISTSLSLLLSLFYMKVILEEFAYQIDYSPQSFLVSIASLLGLIILASGIQLYYVVNAPPANSLRYE